MGCYNCKYLDTSDKKEGVCGARYYCTKNKKYVTGNSECENYLYDYARKTYVKDEIYNDGVRFSDDDTPIGTYIFILIVIIIIGCILNVLTF